MSNLKTILGIGLIIVSLAALVLWETKGRDALILKEVIVAKESIEAGTLINKDMFIVKGIPTDNMINGAINSVGLDSILGKKTNSYIPQNAQITKDYFISDDTVIKKDQSVFALNGSWIYMKSSSIRKGDLVDIYSNDNTFTDYLGTYKVAFVKDENVREVVSTDESGIISDEKQILNRIYASAPVDHIEIICTIEDYKLIKNTIVSSDIENPKSLIIVQRSNGIDS